MAHFAEIDQNNIVTKVIVISNDELLDNGQESEAKGIDFCESLFGHRNWVQTSYNGSIRYNFASSGYTWDSENDAFYAPKPFASWTLNEKYEWVSPIPYPQDGEWYDWNEDTKSWDLIIK